jgi:hypothetical protein
VTETMDLMGGVVTTPDSKVLPKRQAARGMLPSTWVGRTLRVEYEGCAGKEANTTATLLDWCPLGPVLNSAGARTIIPWERIVSAELVAD